MSPQLTRCARGSSDFDDYYDFISKLRVARTKIISEQNQLFWGGFISKDEVRFCVDLLFLFIQNNFNDLGHLKMNQSL